MNLRQAAELWDAYRAELCVLDRIAPTTLANQRQIATGILAAIGDHDLEALRKSHVDLWVAARLQTCQPVTVQAGLGVLKQILNWCVDEQHLAKRPRLPTVTVANVERVLPSDADYIWYLRNLTPDKSEALEFMLLTGLAPHELARLAVMDYRPDTNEVAIGDRADFRVKQPARRRPIPLNARASSIWIAHSLGRLHWQTVFPREGALQKSMRRLFLSREDAPVGTNGLTPKMMRKWFASKIAVSHSEGLLQVLLGHAPGSTVTRKHYVRTSQMQREAAVAAIVPL